MDTVQDKKVWEGGTLKGCVIERIDKSQVENGGYVIVCTYKGRNMTLRSMDKPDLDKYLNSKEAVDLEWHKEDKAWFLDSVKVQQPNAPVYLAPRDLDNTPDAETVGLPVALPELGLCDFDKQASFAKKITSVIDTCHLYAVIGGKKFVEVEGWEALGAMTQHTAIIKSVSEGADYFEALAELQDGVGRVVSSGIARAYKEETLKTRNGEVHKRWEQPYQVMSMAQTRAIGKAYRNKLAWVIRLAGYSPTPAEEMANGAD
jgi:hypothetical protein